MNDIILEEKYILKNYNNNYFNKRKKMEIVWEFL